MKLRNLINLKALKETSAEDYLANSGTEEIKKVKVNILDDEQEVTIKYKPGSNLKDVTITWNEPWGEEEHNVDFEYESDEWRSGDLDGSGSEDLTVTAESEGGKGWKFVFSLIAQVENTFDMTGDFADWDWESLEVDKVEDPTMKGGWPTTEGEEDVEEGTCGYGKDGKIGKKPAGPDMLQERFQQLAGLKPLYEQGFDDRLISEKTKISPTVRLKLKDIQDKISRWLKGGATPRPDDPLLQQLVGDLMNEQGFDDRFDKAMTGAGFSGEEKDDIMSRDIGDPFLDDDDDMSPGAELASRTIEKFRQQYRGMSDQDLDDFSVAMVEHFLDNLSAQVRAKTILTTRGI